MTRYVSTEERRTASPIGLRVQRIHELEMLGERVAHELAAERAALQRIMGCRPQTSSSAIAEALRVSPARIREWARVNGWPDINARGRVPAVVATAFAAAHPDEELTAPRPSPGQIREWARDNGFPKVGRTGCIPAPIIAAFEAAHTQADQ